jgi:rod shape-determining protein MreD
VNLLNRDRLGAFVTLCLVTLVALAARVWFGDAQLLFGVRVDIPVLALSLASMARGARFGALAGFILGLVVDAVQPEWLGASAVGYALVGFFSGSFGQTIYVDKTRARAALATASVLLFDITFGVLTVGLASPFVVRALASLGSAAVTGGVTALLSRAWQLTFATARSRIDPVADD